MPYWIGGSNNPTRIPIIEITTKNGIFVTSSQQ